MVRPAFLLLHRYVGLFLAGFLIVIGLTGSIIVFFNVLDLWLNPDLLEVEPACQAMDILDLRDRLEAQDPRSHVYGVHFPKRPDRSMAAYVEGAIDPATGVAYDIGYDEVFGDQYTGRRLGERMWGDFSLERKDIATAIYFLHYSLVLPEALGEGFMGIVALIWAVDCLVALYLTFPRRHGTDGGGRGFWRRWGAAWRVRKKSGSHRFVFDWHRASGLWLFPMLLIFAVSGFAFNMPRSYDAVMSRLTNFADNDVQPYLAEPLVSPAVGWREALALGEKYMAEQAADHGFTVNEPFMLIYRREFGIYDYRVDSSRDLVPYGYTSVAIDATTGALRGVDIPTGQTAAITFTSWIKALHQAMVFGLPYKLFVSAAGLLIVALTVTGVVVSWRKRRARRISRSRQATAPPPGAKPSPRSSPAASTLPSCPASPPRYPRPRR